MGIYGLSRYWYGECHRIECDGETLEERLALCQQLDLLGALLILLVMPRSRLCASLR